MFGYNVVEINGNDFNEIDNAFSNISSKKPNIIIADTVKGKGISFMENKIEWHSKKVNEDEYIKSLKELEKQEESINE